MSRVFVVQVPAFRGPDGTWVEKYDLSAAEAFGGLIRVLPFGNVPSDPGPTRSALFSVFSVFDPDEDYVLLLGDPVAIAQAVAVVLQFHRRPFRVLKWDRRGRRYEPYVVG